LAIAEVSSFSFGGRIRSPFCFSDYDFQPSQAHCLVIKRRKLVRMGILVWLIIINVAVFVHELAHYLGARAQGVNVKAFSIGMGPILARRVWKGTEWRVSAFPIGGYVDIDGLAPTEFTADGKPVPPTTGYSKLGYWGKFAILFAGPLSNVILAILIVALALLGQGRPVSLGKIEFSNVLADFPAASAGFQRGDVLVSINGQPVKTPGEVQDNLKTNGSRTYTIERAGQRLDIAFDWSPRAFAGADRPKFGVTIGEQTRFEAVGPIEALSNSTTLLVSNIPSMVQAIVGGIFRTLTLQRDENLQGPVGAVTTTGQVAQQGLFQILFLAGVINLSLGVFNLLPIPGLDGGRILLATIAAVRRKPFAPGQEEQFNFAGFVFVILFIVLVTVQDVGRLFR
jgi:regulator of sigma E protease